MKVGKTNYVLLPDDLIGGIFSRLSVKDLLRIRCVCKSWRALIDDYSFILMHHHAQYATSKADGDVPFLLWFHMMLMHPDQCHLFSKHGGDDVLLNLISDVERDRRFALTVDPNIIVNTICRGSGNGIICLNIELFNNQLGDFEFYCGLWNPATRDFKIVAFPKAPDQLLPRCSCVVGFMYDALCNDFKIMARTCIVSDSDSPYINLAYDIFSLSTNSWKRLSNQPIYSGARGPGLAIVSPSTMDAFVNGVYYWIADLSNDDETKDYILSFQLSTETFKLSDLPQGIAQPMNMNMDQLFGREIGLYKESLAIYVTQNPEQQVGHVEIWVVTEFDKVGAPIAWQCLFVTAPIQVSSGPYVVGSRLDGDLLVKIDDMLWVYNPTTNKFSERNIAVSQCFRYVESLFPLTRRVIRG